MKRELLSIARAAGLLRQADSLLLLRDWIMYSASNRRFARDNPDFALPPANLAFDAYGNLDRKAYRDGGLRHAQLYADILRECTAEKSLSILEWGCGPGRIIRHIRSCLSDYAIDLTGSDCNPRTIAWNREHIANVNFVVNAFMPPLPFAEGSFDVVYNFSVFTHLLEATQKAWAAELFRVLKPGGFLICSTHGDYYCNKLARKDEAARYMRGQVVVQEHYTEGKKWFLALHPPRYVRDDLLQQFGNVRSIAVPQDACMRHDLWVAQKIAKHSGSRDAAALAAHAEPS